MAAGPAPVTVTRLVFQVGEAELEVQVSAAATATAGDLAAALAGGPVAPGTGLVAGGRLLAQPVPLPGCGLRQGDTVALATAPPAPAAAAPPVAFLHVVGGTAAGGCVPLHPGAVVLGRAGDVVLDHPTVSAGHARLRVGPGGCTVEDLGSTNGTRLDGRFVAG
ncbi:MAG TPA: FHA domain-containing protein, partial [Acidimicrobiales bacterium]|nr:FHA domain-containing protein [Acidimicrobiales bacterium]